MDDCKIVTDLLPSYCDELTSWETNTYIRTHLNSCPGCGRLLEQMQQRKEPDEADIRRADFRAALKMYERRHKVRMGVIALVCLVLVAAFFIVRACSFEIAIAGSGLNRQQLQVVQEPTTGADGKMFQIIFSRTKEDEAALVSLKKNVLGFWTVSGTETATPNHSAQIVWSEPLFSFYGGEPDITTVFHTVCAGSNAVASFEDLPYDRIPGNVTVMATQNGSYYYIHVITVLPGSGTPFNIMPLLKESGMIS